MSTPVRALAMATLAVALLLDPTLLAGRNAEAYSVCGSVSGQYICAARWYSKRIPWKDATGWTGSKRSAIVSAGQKWDAVPGPLNFAEDTSPYGPYAAPLYLYDLNSIGLYNIPGATWDYGSYGDIYNISSAELVLSTNFTWNTTGTMNVPNWQSDVLTVTLHEMGHFMLLGHPCVSLTPYNAAVMCPYPTIAKQNLTADDSAGVQALYY